MALSVRDWLNQNWSKFSEQPKHELFNLCAKELEVQVRSVERMYYKMASDGPIYKDAEPVKPKLGLSEEAFRSKFDLEFKIKKAAEGLKRGVYLTEAEFMKVAEIRPVSGYRQILDKFTSYRGKASGGGYYYSHPDSIKQMKEEAILT